MTTKISRPVYIPFSQPFLSPFAGYSNGVFDAVGFNSKDNYIYGIEENTNNVIRLKRGNTFERIGIVSIVDTLKSHAGDCTPEGLFLVHDYKLNQILVFEVVEDFQLLDRINLFWNPESLITGDFELRIFDFAIDPNNPLVAYAHQGTFEAEHSGPNETRGHILSINLDFASPDLGMVTPTAVVDQNQATHFGGLIFSPGSQLVGYGSNQDGLHPEQETFFSINPFTGMVSDMAINNQGVMVSDGCSCPYSFTFTLSVPTEGMYCNDEQKTFTININNNAFNPIEDVVLIDTFPEGMVIEEISDTYIGQISAGTGLGSNILEIAQLEIPAKTEVEIKIKVRSIDAAVGQISNQAFLHNLPERFEGIMKSDDRATTGEIGDASKFTVIPRRLEDVSWAITPPSDCLIATDGQIEVSSPQFFAGQMFEVKLRNKIGWDEFTYVVEIDENSSFKLDSLLPGDYQLYDLRSISDNCSLAIKDTTILLEAPNDQLMLDVSSNSPVCEGEDLLLNSTVSPDGIVRWTGPNVYAADIYNPIIETVIPDYTGEFKIKANYGFCEQIKFLDIQVFGEINASIAGQTEYCERDDLMLIVEGFGENLNHRWSGPNSVVGTDSVLIVNSVNQNLDGYFEVITTNGACYDTVGFEVEILPTPNLQLPEALFTDFCAPLVLMPEITGDQNVEYQWFPQVGLSCYDCLQPEVQPIVQDQYQLIVENEHQCQDSATVQIALDESGIFFTPNVFMLNTQNGNDQFKFYPGCIVENLNRFEIFDRSGTSVYKREEVASIQADGFWDGRLNGTMVSAGVYVWFAEIELVDGSIRYLSGDVTVLE